GPWRRRAREGSRGAACGRRAAVSRRVECARRLRALRLVPAVCARGSALAAAFRVVPGAAAARAPPDQADHGRSFGGGWDQSDKFVKIYITLPGVHQVPTENVQVHFTERSFDLLVKNLNGKSYSMIVNNLLKPISVEGSSKKVKTDTVLILCRKKAENTRWDYLTQVEKECKEKEKPSYDTETDPSEGLMNVLKKIYEDGDDDMKRTINKAWVESREKQAKGETEF
uniref:Calcyclin binding protein n=1 Tax=Equus caballus TaxID=9796 RepID=A0A3Q2LIS9_HORSE